MLHKESHTNRWLIGLKTETRDEANGRLSLFIRPDLKAGWYQRRGFNICFCELENSKRISNRFPSPFLFFYSTITCILLFQISLKIFYIFMCVIGFNSQFLRLEYIFFRKFREKITANMR